MLKIVENLWAVGAPPRTPLEELTALPQTLGREGLLPLPNNPPLSVFSPSVLPPPPMKNGHALVVVTIDH